MAPMPRRSRRPSRGRRGPAVRSCVPSQASSPRRRPRARATSTTTASRTSSRNPDPARVREMVALLEDRTRLAELLPPVIGEGEVHVAIGAENRVEPLLDCSLVFGRYGGTSGGVVGYVGIVGPRRMDYARSIGAVSVVGRLRAGPRL